MPVSATILLVEDDPNDALFAQRALRQAGVANPVVLLEDGEQAIQYLQGLPPYDDRGRCPLPGLILLDLKMPKYSGFEVLEWLQSRSEVAVIPVVILTGSLYAEDRNRAQRLGAKAYEIKPVDSTRLAAIAANLQPNAPPPAS